MTTVLYCLLGTVYKIMGLKAEQIEDGALKVMVTPKQRKFLKKSRNKKIRKTKIENEPLPKKYDGWAV